MARRNRQTFKKREREMARKQKKQDKAQRMADRKALRSLPPDGKLPATLDDSNDPLSCEAPGTSPIRPADNA